MGHSSVLHHHRMGTLVSTKRILIIKSKMKNPKSKNLNVLTFLIRYRSLYTFGLVLFAACALCIGCSSNRVTTGIGAEERYLMARRLLDKGDCTKATEMFQMVIFNFPGSDYVDDAEFGLGEAHYCVKEYAMASTQFRRILRDYPLSPFADDAQFMLGMCYYEQSLPSSLDQEFTQKAIESFRKMIEDHPGSERIDEAREKVKGLENRLAKKDFETGRLYLRLEYYGSALSYFEFILTLYPDSKWAPEARYGIGQIFEKQEKQIEALAAYQRVVTDYPAEKAAEKARKKIDGLREKNNK